MNKKLIENRIKRFNEAIKIVKKFPDIDDQKDIALKMGYDRGGTISDYKNINKYDEERFTKFVNHFAATFNLSADYILSGRGELIVNRGYKEPEDHSRTLSEPEVPMVRPKTFLEDPFNDETLLALERITRNYINALDGMPPTGAVRNAYMGIVMETKHADLMANVLYRLDNVEDKLREISGEED